MAYVRDGTPFSSHLLFFFINGPMLKNVSNENNVKGMMGGVGGECVCV